jgi:uncharacterized protein GlcG (DUF336 family)
MSSSMTTKLAGVAAICFDVQGGGGLASGLALAHRTRVGDRADNASHSGVHAASRIVYAGDGAGALSREVARRKAYTASQLRVSTADFAKRVAGGGFNPAVFDTQLMTAVGGLPIKVGEETVAGIGVSGAPGGDKDEACAQAGLAKIADRLK